MHLREYIAALSNDWMALMSGVGSVLLAFWAAFFPPQDFQAARVLLFLCAAACFAVSSYRIWSAEYQRRLRFEDLYCKPRVALTFLADQPGFVAPKTIRDKHYRVLRVRVTNVGGESLHNLRAQLKLSTSHYSYSNIDLILKEEDLPIIERVVTRRDDRVLPTPKTTFGLERGEEQFINLAMQKNVDGKWDGVELCLSHIGADNYNNQLTVNEPISFSVIVLGGIYPPYSQSFVMFLDKNGILQLKDS
jgi:hypothetical protein